MKAAAVKELVSGDERSGSGSRAMQNAIADACFRYRAISVVPVILVIYFVFQAGDAGRFNSPLNLAGFLLALLGAATRVIAVGHAKPFTSGRENFLKAESLNSSGLYAIVRNPLYVGNFLIYNGILVAYSSLGALAFFNAFFVVNYYFIIMAEERYLAGQFGAAYDEYRRTVPKFLPDFRLYRKNDHPFQLARVVAKEHKTTLYWVFFYVITLLVKQYQLNNGAIVGFWWHAIPVFVLFALSIFLTLTKKSNPA